MIWNSDQMNICESGTGEHIDNLELFEEKTFVSKLLGMGDIQASLQFCQIRELAKSLLQQKSEWVLYLR